MTPKIHYNRKGVEAVARALKENGVVSIRGNRGTGKSTFAYDVATSITRGESVRIHIAVGNGRQRGTEFHPFSEKNKTILPERLRTSLSSNAGPIIGALIALWNPVGFVVSPILNFIQSVISKDEPISGIFDRDEVQNAGIFTQRHKKTHVFIFDNIHFWDARSIGLAAKCIEERHTLNVYLILVCTEEDRPFSDEVSYLLAKLSMNNQTQYVFDGLEPSCIKDAFLPNLSQKHFEMILTQVGRNLVSIKRIADSLSRQPADPQTLSDADIERVLNTERESVLNLFDFPTHYIVVLQCLALMGGVASLDQLKCALAQNKTIISPMLRWGEQNRIIILNKSYLRFSHDIYYFVFFDVDSQRLALAAKIGECMEQMNPDDYQARIRVSLLQEDDDLTTSLVCSELRVRLTLGRLSEERHGQELSSIKELLGNKFQAIHLNMFNRFIDIARLMRHGRFLNAIEEVTFLPFARIQRTRHEEVIVAAYLALLSRDSDVRASVTKDIEASLNERSKLEIEQHFSLAAYYAYSRGLDGRHEAASDTLAHLQSLLTSNLDRFTKANYYLTVIKRMSPIWCEAKIAKRELSRAFKEVQYGDFHSGSSAHLEEKIKVTANYSSVLIKLGEEKEALDAIKQCNQSISAFDTNWSRAKLFMENNFLIARHLENPKYLRQSCHRWWEMQQSDPHLRIVFLINCLSCFIELRQERIGQVTAREVIHDLVEILKTNNSPEVFYYYSARFTVWQYELAVLRTSDVTFSLSEMESLLGKIPYVTAKYYQNRHRFIVDATKKPDFDHNNWEEMAFNSVTADQLPLSYQKIVRYHTLESWLP